MRNLVRCVFLLVAAVAVGFQIQGCGSSTPAAPPATPSCVRRSDCKNPLLICADSFCVAECEASLDCSNGARCIISADGNTCQPPEKKTCQFNSDCTPGLVCGTDSQCRNQCKTDVDCPKSQKCTSVSLLCADPTTDRDYDKTTNEFKTPDAGTPGGSGGSSGDGGGTGGSSGDGGPAGDGPANLDGPGTVLTDGVTVMPNASIRPGQGNITITVTNTAGGLANPTVIDLGPKVTGRAQDTSTDTMLVLKVSVEHGAPLGKRTLKFLSAGGIFSAADVVEVTPISVSGTGMDSNPGSAAAPFKTLKQAILTSGGGDTIHVADGTYNATSGETWGYVIPDNVTIVGDSTEMTVLDGAGSVGNPNGFEASTGLTLKSLTVQNFYSGIDIKKPNSTVTMTDVAIATNSLYGIYLEMPATGSTITFGGAKGLINMPGKQAIYAYYNTDSTINLMDGKIRGGSYVIQISGNCSGLKLNATSATIEQLSMNSYDALNVGVSSNMNGTAVVFDKVTMIGGIQDSDAKGSLTVTNSTITQKYGTGVDFSGKSLSMTGTTITMMNVAAGIYYHSMQGAMSLKNVTVDGGGYGIQQAAPGSSSKVRGTTIKNSNYHGYYISGGDLDMGTATDAGNNILGTPINASYYCLAIQRGGGANGGMPISCSETAFAATGPNDGQRPSAMMISADSAVVTQAPQLYYVGVGDKLNFY